jgi:hypothetical protein
MYVDEDGNYAGMVTTRDKHVLEVLDYGQYVPYLVRKRLKCRKSKNRCLVTHLLIGIFGDEESDIVKGIEENSNMKLLKRELNSRQMRECSDIGQLMKIVGKYRNIYIRIYDPDHDQFSNEVVVIFSPDYTKSVTLGFIQDHYILLKQH